MSGDIDETFTLSEDVFHCIMDSDQQQGKAPQMAVKSALEIIELGLSSWMLLKCIAV